MNTSASATSRRNTACPDGARRSSARLFLLRPSSSKPGLLASPGPIGGVARRRYGSPAPGGSILITSAPKSDMIVAAAGPAIQLAQSMTLRPENRCLVIWLRLLIAEDDRAGRREHATDAVTDGNLRAGDLRWRNAAHLPHALL